MWRNQATLLRIQPLQLRKTSSTSALFSTAPACSSLKPASGIRPVVARRIGNNTKSPPIKPSSAVLRSERHLWRQYHFKVFFETFVIPAVFVQLPGFKSPFRCHQRACRMAHLKPFREELPYLATSVLKSPDLTISGLSQARPVRRYLAACWNRKLVHPLWPMLPRLCLVKL